MKREKTKHGGIYRVGDTYYITYYVGSKKYEKAAGPRLSLALREKMKRENRAKRGNYEAVERQEKMTFNELTDLYQREGDGKKYILQFIPAYLKHFGGRKLSQITRKDLFSFRDTLKATPRQRGGAEVTNSTVNRALAGLRRLFHFAISKECLVESPFPTIPKSGLFYPEQKGLRNFFTEMQIDGIIEAAPEWLKPMVITAYYTGLRLGELLSLRWGWVDLVNGIIYLPLTKTMKDPTGRGQKVVMQKELIDLFHRLPKGSEWVFCREDGIPYTRDHVYGPFKRLLKSLDIDHRQYSWKELRHTTATLMHLKGAEIKSIKDQLRHTSIKMTEGFYIGSDVNYQRKQNERLTLNSGKIVGKDEFSDPAQLPTA